FGQAPFLTEGGGSARSGCQAQWSALRWARLNSVFFAAAPAPSPFGQGAPRFTHWVRSAICSAGSFPFGGMRSSTFLYETASTSRLLSRLPGTRAGPVSPPLSAASRLSSRRPPFSLVAVAL